LLGVESGRGLAAFGGGVYLENGDFGGVYMMDLAFLDVSWFKLFILLRRKMEIFTRHLFPLTRA